MRVIRKFRKFFGVVLFEGLLIDYVNKKVVNELFFKVGYFEFEWWFFVVFFFVGRFINRIVLLKDEDGEKSIEYY